MYYPYFRGKQYELITIRETAKYLSECNAVPIIEPVKSSLSSLEKTIKVLIKEEVEFILIVNPKVGELKDKSIALDKQFLKETFGEYGKYLLGYIVDASAYIDDVTTFLDAHKDYNVALIHHDFPDSSKLKAESDQRVNVRAHIFIEQYAQKLYRRKFSKKGVRKILIRDGFNKNKNADYPPDEHFSDLHITYEDEQMDGFGDFLIVGDEYSEVGGPAWAVAIHITYFDEDDDMRIKHFISDSNASAANPAGKFKEALRKLVNECNDSESRVEKTPSCDEFIDLFKIGHFPGLGYVKKLSMKHHVEILREYLNSQ